MCEFKSQPLPQLMRMVHPDLYRLDNMSDQVGHVQQNLQSKPGRRVESCFLFERFKRSKVEFAHEASVVLLDL